MALLKKATGLIVTNLLNKTYLSDKYAKDFIKKNFVKKEVDNSLSTLSFLNYQTHKIISFDKTVINAYEFKINNSMNYIFLLHGFNQQNDDFVNIINGFLLKNYNVILLDNRLDITYGVKECFDLLYVIDYFSTIYKDINICLFGEETGANIIIKALKSKLNNQVKCVIVDNPGTNLKNDLINFYLNEKQINQNSFESMINHELNKIYNFDLNDLSLNNCLNENTIPICFIYSKVKSNFGYRNLLKIYNQNKNEKKFYFTNALKRNYEEENYFDVLDKFIKNYF